MSTLVCNGISLLRRADSLVRTPIMIHLAPDQKKVYQIGNPASVGSDGYLNAGFTQGGTDPSTVSGVGWRLVNQMIYGAPRWLDASGPHDPEFVWYQGAYSTSNSYISYGKYQSEAYAQLAGFHFSLPAVARGHVASVKVNFQNMGCVWAYGPAINGNIYNKNLKQADYGWTTGGWTQSFYFLPTETCNYHQTYILLHFDCDDVELADYGGAGDFRGQRILWEMSGQPGQFDGRIPTLTNPVTQSYYLGATTLAQFKSNNGGWIVPCIDPSLTSSTNYIPASGWGGDGNNNYWACVSLRDITVDVVLDLGES